VSPRGRRAGRQRGQSTVEFALVLPLVVLILLVVVQVGLVVRDQVLVVHAAREAARAASVGGTDDQVRRAAIGAGPLSAGRLSVTIDRADGPTGGTVRVSVHYRSQTDLPLVGALVPDLDLTADAVMAREE
jgi:Flp pilus assembly protein TadG